MLPCQFARLFLLIAAAVATKRPAARGMVVSTNKHASDIGASILSQGGNAFDAAIAVQFALSVVEPVFVGPFDGCNLMFFDAAAASVKHLDGREEAPELFHGNIFCQDDDCMTNRSCSCTKGPFPTAERETGGLGFGVPGCMAAVKKLVDEGRTTMSLRKLVQPAVDLAREGFVWDEIFHGMVTAESTYLAYFNSTAQMYLKSDGVTPKIGVNETFKNPDLADLMLKLAAPGGIEDMYNGSLAKLLVKTANEAVNKVTGRYSPVQLSDFAQYRAVYRQPTTVVYRENFTVHGPSLPYSGGVSLAQMLNWADSFDLAGSQDFAASLGVLLDAQNTAFADRDRFLADPDFIEVPTKGLLSKAYTRSRVKALYDKQKKQAVVVPVAPGSPPSATGKQFATAQGRDKGTSHFTVADADGNVVAWTTTLNSLFGSRVIVPGTGTFLNDQLCDFEPQAVDPVSGLRFANAPEGGKRPRRTALGKDRDSLGGKRALSSQAPTIVLNTVGLPVLALGSPGGSCIISAVLSVLHTVIDRGMSVQDATNAARALARNSGPSTLEGWGQNIAANTVEYLHAHNYSFTVEQYPPPYTETEPRGDGGFHHFGAVSLVQIGYNGSSLWFEGAADHIRVPEAAAVASLRAARPLRTRPHLVRRPNVSLASIPVAYFGGKGGKSGPRSAANIAMLAKMRLVMLEKWEGGCWDTCLKNATSTPPLPCRSSCNVEADTLETLRQVRKLNPAVTTVVYLNALMLFPFYKLVDKYVAANALLMDAQTGKPVTLHNDDGMPGVFVPDFGQQQGRDLWLSQIEEWVATGLVDGIFADKWPNKANAYQNNESDWVICNKKCAHITPEDGEAFNSGKELLRANVSQFFGVDSDAYQGLLYGDGCDGCYRKSPRIDGNLVGPWLKNWQFAPPRPKVPGQNVWRMIQQTREMLHKYNYSFVYVGCGDHHPSENKPFPPSCAEDLCTDCTPQGIAIFLLLVEEGVFLGANGWHPAFDRPLGSPLGPALNVSNDKGDVVGLTRHFASGTTVHFNLTNNSGTIEWGQTT